MLKEDIRQKFTALYEHVDRLRTYVEKTYGILDVDIFEETQRDDYHPSPKEHKTSLTHAYGALTDVERAIFRMIQTQQQPQPSKPKKLSKKK